MSVVKHNTATGYSERVLPVGWARAKLADITEDVAKTNPKTDPDKTFTYLDIASIDNSQAKIVSPKEYRGLEAPSRARQLVRSGDILFSTVRTYLKNIASVPSLYDGEVASTGFCVIRPSNGIDNKFIFYIMRTEDFVNPLNELQRGTSYPAVRDSDVLTQVVPIAPQNEQHLIVAKIEELFTRLDAGVSNLEKIKGQLEIYRQSVLKNAFQGKLTKDWRFRLAEPKNSELDFVSGECTQNALSRKNPRYLSEMPDHWTWTTIKQVSERLQYGTSEKASPDTSGIPVIAMGNIQKGKLVFDGFKSFPRNWHKLTDYLLQDGDVLFNRTNSAELVGKTAVYHAGDPTAVFASYLIRIQINKRCYEPDLLAYFINSSQGREYIASVVSQQVGQANVNGKKLGSMAIPLPNVTEQRAIAQEIGRHFGVTDQIEKSTELALKYVKKLRQVILRKAFAGALVPQRPSEEPAPVLLQRIQAAKRETLASPYKLKV